MRYKKMSMKNNEIKTLEDLKRGFPKSVLVTKYKLTEEDVSDLSNKWINSHQYRTGSPWVTELQYFEQEYLNLQFQKKFDNEIQALTEMLPATGKKVVVVSESGIKYEANVEKTGELDIKVSAPKAVPTHINEFRGKDYKHLVWCLSQDEMTDGLKRKIKRYILHSL